MKKIKGFLSFLMRKRWLAGIIVLAGLAGVIWIGFPYEINVAATAFQLWMGKIEDVQIGEFRGISRDECQTAKNCSCVVLLHGEGDDARAWQNVLLWPETGWGRLGMDRPKRLLALHLPGVGGTPRPTDPEDYRARRIAEKLKGPLGELCPSWIGVGNGFGGAVAAWLGLVWPDGVGRLILIGSTGLAVQRRNPGIFAEEVTRDSMKEFLGHAYFQAPDIGNRLVDEMIFRTRRSDIKSLLAAQVEEDDLDLRLTTLVTPTLVLWGEADRVTPLAEGRSMRTLMPNGIIREIQKCGHFIQKECPLFLVQGIVDMTKYGAM